ncbi:hypothetical protein SBOR_9111 [Sclerotinia borealis F-4128]|uniref:Uncharacterized protein n=1 Tax=Sclerotinia borealis (strain F-4128) TaxID=1432307 RepID=W9C7F9_SCLBF|nr:hypothetical protein SBOR_9111 [Sclerotinia borealis F-4128]
MYLNVDTGTFNQSLLIRDSRECATGQQWWVCNANGFQGCCSVDACSVSKCPDTNTAAVGASISSTSSSSKSTSSSSTSTSSTTSTISSQSTQSSQTTPQTPSPSTLLITKTVNNPLNTSSSPSSSTLAQATPSTSSNSTPIIAGAIIGGIALLCFAMAAFCCFRFRQKKKQERERMFAEPESPDPETIQFYSTTGKALQTPSSTRTSRSPSGGFGGLGGLGLGDVFAPFGGRTRSTRTTQPPPSPPKVPAITQSQNLSPVHPIHPIHAIHPSPISESTEDYENDQPLSPDPEKSSLIPPPESSHPAYHPLPGVSCVRPAYRPGMSFTINELDGREVDCVPFGTAGGRRSGSLGNIEGCDSGSGSEGVVSAMSTPNTNEMVNSNGKLSAINTPTPTHYSLSNPFTSTNIPPSQGNWQLPPAALIPGRPAPSQFQSQSQSYHQRGSNSANGGSNPNIANPSQNQTQTQYQHQHQKQLSQARRTNSTVIENPYQMYGSSREHQQNMGYQNALERAQSQSQTNTPAPGKGGNGKTTRVTRQENGRLTRESSTHSIPIGLGLEARDSVPISGAVSASVSASGFVGVEAQPYAYMGMRNSNLNRYPEMNNRNSNTNAHPSAYAQIQTPAHASLYGNTRVFPLTVQYTPTDTHAHAHSNSGQSERNKVRGHGHGHVLSWAEYGNVNVNENGDVNEGGVIESGKEKEKEKEKGNGFVQYE